MSVINKLEERHKTLDRVNLWISNCDTKISFFLALLGVFFTLLFTTDFSKLMKRTMEYEISQRISLSAFLLFIEYFSLVLLFIFSILALVYIFSTLKARLNFSDYDETDLDTNSDLFFGTISAKSFVEYKSSVNSKEYNEYLNDLESQIFINSKISSIKFDRYNSSLKSFRNIFISIVTYLIMANINDLQYTL